MADPSVAKLADLIVNYSVGLQPDDVVRLGGETVATPLLVELYRASLAAGAHPQLRVALEETERILLSEGSEEQISFVSDLERHAVEVVDAEITIWADRNTRALTHVPPDRVRQRMAARRTTINRYWDRIDAGEARWCGTRYPTEAHAQEAGMSLADYATFVYAACHVLPDEDPVAHWEGVSLDLNARARELEAVRELRVVGPDTDLRLGVAGRGWIAADGRLNMPDGEIFTSPVETETEGEIRFAFPGIFSGRAVEDVRLRFEGGRVVAAEAAEGGDLLRSLLDMDDGARVLGEAAFGLNYEIDRFTRDILFDEKIGGTMHFALGSCFKKLGGRNESALHWDLICDLRSDGEVYADGELVWKAGRFLREPQPAGAVAAR
jgi:aminopeptidase